MQLPPALARWLSCQGFPPEHVVDRDMGSTDDEAIWAFASENGYVIVSRDDDFATKRIMATDGPQVVWV